MRLIEINKISNFNNTSFFLPNSVDLLSNGDIVICDGGNDRICLFNKDFKPIKQYGKKGWSKKRFKEPVGAFVLKNDNVFVMDWHNHRVVELDKEMNYLHEFGHYSNSNIKAGFVKNIFIEIKNVLKILKRLPFNGSYIDFHFQKRVKKSVKYLKISELIISFFGALNSMRLNLIHGVFFNGGFNKPNGITVVKNNIVITQKKNKCLSIHDNFRPYKRKKNIYRINNKNFGNLGNIYSSNNRVFICDELKSRVFILDSDLNYLDSIEGRDVSMMNFSPFSCCSIDNNLLAVVSQKLFLIYDFNDKKLIYRSDEIGELHGIAFNSITRKIYVCDRANSCIHIYQIER
ncbi:MAG: hypothetical protein ACI93P_000163 [bacterium]|jgi:hypothetical protein